jgi:hypothetical protein
VSEHTDATLGALTAGWEPAPGVPDGNLERARATLAAGLARGKTPSELDPAIALKPARTGEAAAPAPGQAPGFTLSALSLSADNPLGVPAWANGAEHGETLGPFVDPLGIDNFVITIPLTQSRTFAFGSPAGGFAVLPVTGAPASATSFTLGGGSVWFAAPLLAPTAATGGFCGFRIAGGTLVASAPATLQGGVYVVPTGASLTLEATLAPPAPGTGTPGGDLTSATVALPPTVTIEFTQTAATIAALGNASLDVYGTSLSLTWNRAAPFPVPNLSVVLVPFTASRSSFAFSSVHSTLFEPAGDAPITAAGWALSVATTAIDMLGEANGAGALLVALGAGGSFTSAARARSPVAGWQVTIAPQALFVVAGGQGGGEASYALWPGLTPGQLPASVAWTNPTGYVASFLANPGHETLTVGGQAIAHLDRPFAADGGRFPIAGNGSLSLARDAAGTTGTILVTTTPPADPYALALENALIGVRAPQLFFVTGPLDAPGFKSCKVSLILATTYLVPILPDPYAANFDLATLVGGDKASATGLLGLGLSWSGGAAVEFGFSLGASASTAILAQPAGLFAPPGPGLTLLDLSTRADLFGVTIPALPEGTPPVPADPGFVGMSLALPDTQVATFALPQMSWEPMESTGPEPPLGAIAADPATDGVATMVRAQDPKQTLVPLAPVPILRRNIANVAAGGSFTAQFSLPFGLVADIDQANRPPFGSTKALFLAEGGAFELVQPSFAAGFGGAFQLMLKPPHPEQPKAQFSGRTTVSAEGAAPGYGYNVLSSDVGTIFEGEFAGAGGAVPVRRIDLAGYGASLFSEWSDAAATGTAIIKVQFETIVGRTAYEVVKARTTLYPYCVTLVRTITIARQNGGWVQRSDSGWVAVSNGIFDFPNAQFTRDLVNRGAVAGVFNVRNVREFETVTAGAFTYRRALFDADIGLDHRVKVTQGGAASALTDVDGNPVTLVAARDLTGYVQIAPDESASGPPPPKPTPEPADLALLFQQVGPIADGFSCIAEVGGTASAPGTGLRCAAIEIDMATAGPTAPALGAALRAAPVLPRDGAWGFGKRASGATAPVALPGNFPVPLVQPKSDPGNWHFADIADVLRLGSPANFYGLLQDTGTQRLLFEQPIVQDLTGGAPPGTVPAIHLPTGVAPALADVGALLNATGLFPDIAKAISLITAGIERLATLPQGLSYSKEYDFVGNEAPTTLLDLTVLQLALIYADASKGKNPSGNWNAPTKVVFNLDPAHTNPQGHGRNWWLTIEPISFAVTVPEFGSDPLLTIIGGFAADDRQKPTLTNLNIDYGSALDTLKSIFSKLQALAAFLPGGAGAGLVVSLSGGKLTVRDTFALPTLPLGLGDLSDISLDLGLSVTLSPLSADFIIGVGDPGNPFNWLLSPLAGNGAIDIGVKGGSPDFLIQGGIGLGLAIDLGIAEGSASITLAVQIDVNGSAITILVILNGQASVDVLGGLASASLSLTAAVGVSVSPLPVPVIEVSPPGIEFPSEDITFLASVAVGIHISICWVVSVNFDGSWQFSQSIHTPALTVDT